MKKIVLFLATALLAACHSNNTGSIFESDLLHRNYVLVDFDGRAIEPKQMTPRIEFGETFHVSGVMCNNFAGQGSLNNNILKVDNLASTRKLCVDETANALDGVIGELLTQGAQLTLQGNALILSNERHRLTFINKDWVH